MSRDDYTIVGLFILALVFFSFILLKEEFNYHIPRSDWKCKQAIVINNDPSNTEYTMYVKTDKVVE